jgi:hypothetical protein
LTARTVIRLCAAPVAAGRSGPGCLTDWTTAFSSLFATLDVLAGSARDSSMRSAIQDPVIEWDNPSGFEIALPGLNRSRGHAPNAADHRTPHREFPRRDGFLDHRRRAGTRSDADAHEPSEAPRPELEHSVSRSGICRQHASPADPNCFAANRLASNRSSAYRDAARGAMVAMRVISAFRGG